MTDLEKTLRELGGAPAHATGFEQRLWAGIDAVDAGSTAGAWGGATAWRRRPVPASPLALGASRAAGSSSRRQSQSRR